MRWTWGLVASGMLVAACGGNEAARDADPTTYAACTDEPAGRTGEGTYYDADGTGNCSFDASPDDLMVAAMNAPDYGTAAWCGGCVEVEGPKGTVTVRIVDKCPGCASGDLDLSREAFAKIADLSAGRVPIAWKQVACPVSGPIEYHHKDGTSQYYTAIQVRNHRYPIATLEARDGTGAWTAIPRVDYNYFVPAKGLGPGPYALRVTDARGQIVEDDSVPFAVDATTPGAAQFPTCN